MSYSVIFLNKLCVCIQLMFCDLGIKNSENNFIGTKNNKEWFSDIIFFTQIAIDQGNITILKSQNNHLSFWWNSLNYE